MTSLLADNAVHLARSLAKSFVVAGELHIFMFTCTNYFPAVIFLAAILKLYVDKCS